MRFYKSFGYTPPENYTENATENDIIVFGKIHFCLKNVAIESYSVIQSYHIFDDSILPTKYSSVKNIALDRKYLAYKFFYRFYYLYTICIIFIKITQKFLFIMEFLAKILSPIIIKIYKHFLQHREFAICSPCTILSNSSRCIVIILILSAYIKWTSCDRWTFKVSVIPKHIYFRTAVCYVVRYHVFTVDVIIFTLTNSV